MEQISDELSGIEIESDDYKKLIARSEDEFIEILKKKSSTQRKQKELSEHYYR